ncbi:hypothetical protein CMQ_7046 [Grosmannia clavigera kw1407]|uniref:Uncharacterized protein n=1 Tax=Grosmannia clavigera (strain kw1407 / UAMH 11150) TaxID=655863 RepID=F0XQB4_GROCL|nr:uncharacterized protein CMQ_7046 [Grosmannia clavigera kw1407]EFX00044.1 hypothetical protein CMQ_7046 [Grosmannia clavigera kw1407]
MGISLHDMPQSDLDALAAMLSLPTDHLDRVDSGMVRPSGSWLADQAALTAQLPSGLLRPPAPLNWAVQASQMAKRVAMGVSGGGDALAARAASEGVRLEARLRPRTAPTVLCPAHRKMHPALIREVFYYVTREVADRADPVRRHSRGDCEYVMCRSVTVRDWGNRMLGVCALWSDRHTFGRLEQGTLGTSSATETAAAATATRRHIEAGQRMPHLQLPCEVCVLAAMAAQSQTLSWVTAFGDDDAAEIRRRSQTLAKELYVVRLCECRRRRRLDQNRLGHHYRYLHARYQSGSGPASSSSSKNPARMATKHGHRLPLPLLPSSQDAWSGLTDLQATVGREEAEAEAEAEGPLRASRVYQRRNLAGSLAESTAHQLEKPAEWEEAYRRHVLESRSEVPPCDGDADDQASFVTMTVHTEAGPSGQVAVVPPIMELPTPPPSPSAAVSVVPAPSSVYSQGDKAGEEHVTSRKHVTSTYRPPAGVRRPVTPASYVALQADVTASFAEGATKTSTRASTRVSAARPPACRPPPPSAYSHRARTHHDDTASTVLPDDSISCVMDRRREREVREQEREREWAERRERRREREERQRQRDKGGGGKSSGKASAKDSGKANAGKNGSSKHPPAASCRPPHRDLPRHRQPAAAPKTTSQAPTMAETDYTATTRWPSGRGR